jgi:hypothetical protein
MANPYKPYGSIGVLRTQTPSGSQCRVVDGVGSRLDINGDHFTVMCRLYLCANGTLVDRIATPSRLLG